MNENQMIYGIKDKIPFNKLILFSIQLLLSVFVATVLIANICGVSVSGALFGAGLSTIFYLIITDYKSPMYISNSGAFVAPVIMALAIGGYTSVALGGVVTCTVYCLFGLLFTKIPVNKIYTIFPKALIGAITMVIGINLMGFIGTYVQVNRETTQWGILIAIFTAIAIALISHYSKGVIKILPFLIGTMLGYLMAVILTVTKVCTFIDFNVFNNIKLFSFPDIAMKHWTDISIKDNIPIILIYIAFTISAMMECLSDHAALSRIIGVDLYENPGIGKIFIGEGLANLASSCFGGLGACSYGEGVACVGFSKVSSTLVTGTCAILMMTLAFINPIQVFINSIPSCVFGGAAIILYGYIACSGVKMLQQINLNDQKNLIIVSSVLSIGISGLAIGNNTFAITGTAFALIFGILLNIILKGEEQYER